MVKGHYIPIVLDRISDNSPIDNLENRRFYLQTYEFTMLGFLIDPEEFKVKPAVSRLFLLTEFLQAKNYEKKFINSSIDIKVATFIADGIQTVFGVGENMRILIFVSLHGLIQIQDTDYYWLGQTSKVTFATPPPKDEKVMIVYYGGRSNVFQDAYGRLLFLEVDNFIYDGSTLTFNLLNNIESMIYLTINGLVDIDGSGYNITANNQITLTSAPGFAGTPISVCYLR